MADQAHVDVAHLVAFLLEKGKLTEQEDEHLSRCSKCMNDMVTAAKSELAAPDTKAKTG